MTNFQFASLKEVQTSELIDVFNRAFADYFVSIALDKRTLEIKTRTENTVLEESVGAFSEGKLVGFILLGIEKGIAYNGGTGVLPEFRGNSLTIKMYDFILPKLNSEGIKSHQLEVITKNLPALKTYERIGFRKVRELACFKGKISTQLFNQDVEVRLIDYLDWQTFLKFWNSYPSWQNSPSAIKRTRDLYKIAGVFRHSKLIGYAIYGKGGSIKQFAVQKEFRHQGIGKTLFGFIQTDLENKEITITNIDENDKETIAFLEKIGLNLFVRQFEMSYDFASKS